MQELVISILLIVVIIMAAVLLIFVGSRKDGMTKKQRIMMIRILISAGILLALQFVSVEMFDIVDGYLFPSAGRWIRFASAIVQKYTPHLREKEIPVNMLKGTAVIKLSVCEMTGKYHA